MPFPVIAARPELALPMQQLVRKEKPEQNFRLFTEQWAQEQNPAAASETKLSVKLLQAPLPELGLATADPR